MRNVGAPVLCMRHKLLVCRALSLVFARTLLPSQAVAQKVFWKSWKKQTSFHWKDLCSRFVNCSVGEVVLEELKREIILCSNTPSLFKFSLYSSEILRVLHSMKCSSKIYFFPYFFAYDCPGLCWHQQRQWAILQGKNKWKTNNLGGSLLL